MKELELRRSSEELVKTLKHMPYRNVPAEVLNATFTLGKTLNTGDKINNAAEQLLAALGTIEALPHGIVNYVNQLSTALAAAS